MQTVPHRAFSLHLLRNSGYLQEKPRLGGSRSTKPVSAGWRGSRFPSPRRGTLWPKAVEARIHSPALLAYTPEGEYGRG